MATQLEILAERAELGWALSKGWFDQLDEGQRERFAAMLVNLNYLQSPDESARLIDAFCADLENIVSLAITAFGELLAHRTVKQTDGPAACEERFVVGVDEYDALELFPEPITLAEARQYMATLPQDVTGVNRIYEIRQVPNMEEQPEPVSTKGHGDD